MSAQPTPEARADYNTLLEALMPFAEQMLKQHGEFFPFAASINAAGEVALNANFEGDESPEPEQVIASFVQAFQSEARAGNIRATGICYNGRIVQDGKKIDAVIMNLEHLTGSSKLCVPYSKGFFGKYRFGEMIAGLGDPKIFVAA